MVKQIGDILYVTEDTQKEYIMEAVKINQKNCFDRSMDKYEIPSVIPDLEQIPIGYYSQNIADIYPVLICMTIKDENEEYMYQPIQNMVDIMDPEEAEKKTRNFLEARESFEKLMSDNVIILPKGAMNDGDITIPLEAYASYVKSHAVDIGAFVNEYFTDSKEYVRARLYKKLKEVYAGRAAETNLTEDRSVIEQIALDYAGTTIQQKDGSTDADVSAESIRCLNIFTSELGTEVMTSAVMTYIEEHFEIELDDNDFDKICEDCDNFREIEKNCIASDFRNCINAVRFAGLGDCRMAELI